MLCSNLAFAAYKIYYTLSVSLELKLSLIISIFICIHFIYILLEGKKDILYNVGRNMLNVHESMFFNRKFHQTIELTRVATHFVER